MTEAIKIDGLAEFVRSLKKIDAEAPKGLRVAFNSAANIVIDYARPRLPYRSGRAARSLRARSTRTVVRVALGGPRAPYVPWLDFGGRVGRKQSIQRPYIPGGRYLFPALDARRAALETALGEALKGSARAAGLEVD